MEGNPYIVASDGLLARKSGEWAKRKHHYLRNYCGITTVSMRSKFKLAQYRKARSGQTALDDFLGDQSWHAWDDKDATEFGGLAVEHFCTSLEKEGFRNTRHISIPESNPLYRCTLSCLQC